MNPLRLARTLRDDYLGLLRTTFAPRQTALRESFHREIERDGFLTREPFVSLSQPYCLGPSLDLLLPETRERFGTLAATPYLHQAQATARLTQGQPVVVATGTGSGKTEAFLMPIVDHCLRTREEPGLKAILVYPMNALASDQLRRVRGLLAGSGVSFGLYTGVTEFSGPRSPEAPEEEKVTRLEIRAEPPQLLLTNYQMLEYLLLRGDGREIFRGHRVRFIVLDEVHTYHGALGTDVACLLRRLRASLGGIPPLFIGTSATLQSDEGQEDPREGVTRFFSRLTGQDTPVEAVITEEVAPLATPAHLTLPAAPEIPAEELASFDPQNQASVMSLARRLAGAPEGDQRGLEELWSGMKLPYLLLHWLHRPLSVEVVAARLAAEPERAGVPLEALRREIEATLLLGPCLPESNPLRLRPRVHRFLRGLARFWRCTNPDCGRLVHDGVESCLTCGARTLPLAICRTCGWDFYAGQELNGRAAPWLGRISTPQTVYYYDSPAVQVAADTEDNPFEGDEESPEEQANADIAGDEDEEAAVEAHAYLCPQCLSLSVSLAERTCACDSGLPLRPVMLHQGRGATCPVCRSRYGRFDVLTPVSLGNSSALTHVSRSLLRELPEENKKLLVFCDSRQDAAHQARFIEGVEGHLRLRRAIYRRLLPGGARHDIRWLVENIYHDYVDEGFLPRTRSHDARRREMDRIEGGVLSEFVLAANVRAGLERLGLVAVRYAGLEEELAGERFRHFCVTQGLSIDVAQLAMMRLLDLLRSRFAINHEVFRTRLSRGDRLSSRYGLIPGRQVGLPVAFLAPGQRSQTTQTFKLLSTWNVGGAPTGAQRLWRRILGEEATMESLAAALEWMQGQGWLSRSRIGRNADEVEGYQVEWGHLELERVHEFVRCRVCGRSAPSDVTDTPCPRPGCEGRLATWAGPLVEGNLNALLIAAEYTPTLRPAEHSAAVSDARRREIEVGFQSDPPTFNVLICTPTLELGVNIGDLEAVAMRNIPPSPANYAQRAGRTGRRSRMGMTVGFARNTPHDGYFFDHPDEAITGAIPPPRFNLANLQAIARHIRSLVLEEARLDYPANLETLISDEGSANAGNLRDLLRQVSAAMGRAGQRAREVFSEQLALLRDDWETWLDATIRDLPAQLETAIENRAALVENAVRQMRELGNHVRQTPRQQEAEQGYRNLARKLREDYRYSYLPRVLAEMGILPGYTFLGDPGSLALGFDPDPIFVGRLQAQREFAPGQVVYARGHRWRVNGIAINRPGAAGRTRGADRFEYTECPACGLAGPATGANYCSRCSAELSGPSCTALDVGAFQAWPADIEPEAEEERAFMGFDVRAHPQRDVGSTNFALDVWTFELRLQEEICWINHGPLRPLVEQPEGRAAGFRLCPECGELRPENLPPPQGPNRPGRRNRDARANRDPHDNRCGGTAVTVALGHQNRADTLRLIVPGLDNLRNEGVAWAWSFAWAIIQGAARLFDLDEDDLEPRVLTRNVDDHAEVMEILWVDNTMGGSGILGELVTRFPQLAAAALEHLRDHDCPSSCYRCLRTYRNQRVHRQLNWHMVVPQLRVAASSTIADLGSSPSSSHVTEGPDWDAARREGCGSPQELRLLVAIRQRGLPEPEKQYRIIDETGRTITLADFAYPAQNLLIYVDSLAFHSSLRMRAYDLAQTNRLQNMGFRVLRFIGPRVTSSPAECISAIQTALRVGED